MTETQAKFNKECAQLQKKINTLERNMMNKIKLAQSSLDKNPLQTSSIKSTVGKDEQQLVKEKQHLKARLNNLEKSYEVLKVKQT